MGGRRSTSRRHAVTVGLVGVVAAGLALVGCAASGADGGAAGPPPGPDQPGLDAGARPDAGHDPEPGAPAGAGADPAGGANAAAPEQPDTEDAGSAGPAVDPAAVGADELGMIPVLMYHRLLDDGGGEYDLTPDEFRAELTWLFDNGYRPITARQLVRREIDVPAGTTPVVLTFDDSTRTQAALTDDGELDPSTALGILVEVAARYDDVEPRASVYVITSSLFGGTAAGERVLAVLHDLGMEIGNHTHTHRSLGTLSADEVRDELATNVATVTGLVPDAEVVTLSLPLGVFPEDRSVVVQGRSAAGEYAHEGVLLVGAGPAPSPFSVGFDPLAIPRIRSSPSWDGGEPDFGSAFWLGQLDLGRSYRRYVSDGDPSTVSFPAGYAADLDPAFAEHANPY